MTDELFDNTVALNKRMETRSIYVKYAASYIFVLPPIRTGLL